MAAHGDYIRQETLSRQVVNGPPAQDAYTETHRVDGFEAVLGVKMRCKSGLPRSN